MNLENVRSAMLQGNDLDYILFKVAIDFAEKGSNVWFISKEPFTKVPKNIVQPEKDILQKIIFIYLKDFNEVLKHLNTTHVWHKTPAIIILTNIDLYCDIFTAEYDALNSGLLIATVLDSAACCSAKKGSKSYVLVTLSGREDKRLVLERLQVFFDMYFDKFYVKESDNDDEVWRDIKDYFL